MSQTPLDYSALLSYEQNLAACYQAEYELSLKLQEHLPSPHPLPTLTTHTDDWEVVDTMSGTSAAGNHNGAYFNGVVGTASNGDDISTKLALNGIGGEFLDDDSMEMDDAMQHPSNISPDNSAVPSTPFYSLVSTPVPHYKLITPFAPSLSSNHHPSAGSDYRINPVTTAVAPSFTTSYHINPLVSAQLTPCSPTVRPLDSTSDCHGDGPSRKKFRLYRPDHEM